MPRSLLVCASLLIVACGPARAAPDAIDLPMKDGSVHAYLFKPEGNGPFPAVVAAHGCNGLGGQAGAVQQHYQDWAALLNKAGYAVLFPDSYGSRNLGPQCRI